MQHCNTENLKLANCWPPSQRNGKENTRMPTSGCRLLHARFLQYFANHTKWSGSNLWEEFHPGFERKCHPAKRDDDRTGGALHLQEQGSSTEGLRAVRGDERSKEDEVHLAGFTEIWAIYAKCNKNILCSRNVICQAGTVTVGYESFGWTYLAVLVTSLMPGTTLIMCLLSCRS